MEMFICFFYVFTTMALTSAVMVVMSTQTIYSALFLILAFFNTALIMLMVGQDFLAIVFMLVYVGAVMMLFLFAIMMLDMKDSTVKYSNIYLYYSFTVLLLLLIFVELVYVEALNFIHVTEFLSSPMNIWFNLVEHYSSMTSFTYLYTMYALYVMLAGLLLFIAMIGAIVLTMSSTKSHSTISNTTAPLFIK